MKFAMLIATLLGSIVVTACGSAYTTPTTSDAGSTIAQQPQLETDVVPTPDPVAPIPVEPSIESEDADPSASTVIEGTPDDEPPQTSYLEATVEPCSPVAGSSRDPCDPARFAGWESSWISYQHPDAVDPPGIAVHGRVPDRPPWTVWDLLREFFEVALTEEPADYPLLLPHVVVRGAFLPGTTRCIVHEYSIRSNSNGNEVWIFKELDPDAIPEGTRCYMEFEAREYLVGKGPAQFTAVPHSRIPYNVRNHELYKQEEFLREVGRRVEEIWEGAELVVWLAASHPSNAHVEVWEVVDTSTVRRESDGRLTVPGLHPIYHRDDLEPYRDRIFPELDDYRREVKLAFQDVPEEFGVTLIDDANQEHLRAYMKSQGLHDIEEVDVVLPPPISPSE